MADTKKKGGIMPLGDRVLLKAVSANEKKSASGIIIPDTMAKEKPEMGKVVAVGEGKRLDDGKYAKMSIKVGDTVLFSKYAPDEVKIDGVEYLIVKEENILAIIK